MKIRLLSGLLAAVLILGLLPVALAAAPIEEEAAQTLAALDIMVGDKQGNLNLDRTITRAQFTKMTIAASTSRDAVGDAVAVKPYPDVPQTHWAAPYIKAAVDLGLVQGDLYGNFHPDQEITLAEGVTIVLRLLGYSDSEFTGMWPAGQMAQYRALELNQNISCGQNESMSRRDALWLFYNLLLTKNKGGSYYLNVLEPTLNLVNADGELDKVALVNSAMEGPVVAGWNWQQQVPLDLSIASIYRNGMAATQDSIQSQDVLYWSESMRTLWAYSDRVTGILEQISPLASAPESVTVAGNTYPIETIEAAYALSDLGQHQVGDQITLLLGRNGGVVAVGTAEEEELLLYGVITKVEDTTYSDGKDGDTYTARSVTIFATNGQTYRYQLSNRYLEEGDLVRVLYQENQAEVTRLSMARISGKVDSKATKLGRYTLAEDVQIIDTYESRTPIRIYASRLAGMNVTEDMVRFYALNAQGEISHLILADATGDLHQYGIITKVDEVDMTLPTGGFVLSSSYIYKVGTAEQVFGSSNAVYNLKVGPCQVKLDSDTNVERLYNLSERKLASVNADGMFALDANQRQYTLSPQVVVYVYDNQSYQLSNLERIAQGDYTLTGWYDKEEKDGGRIRVIVAR